MQRLLDLQRTGFLVIYDISYMAYDVYIGLYMQIYIYICIIYICAHIQSKYLIDSYCANLPTKNIFWFWGGSCCELFGTNVPWNKLAFSVPTGPEDWISGDGRCGEGEMQIGSHGDLCVLTSQEVIISYRAYRVMMVMCYFWLAKLTPDDLSAVMLNVFQLQFCSFYC